MQLQNKAFLKFLGKFLIIYFLLTSPWLPFSEGYARITRNITGKIFHNFGNTGRVTLEVKKKSDFDTKLIVCNKAIKDSSGSIIGIEASIKIYLLGYIETAMITGLIFASPVTWRRRFQSWFISFTIVQLIFILKIWLSILNPRSGVLNMVYKIQIGRAHV